MVRRLLAGEVIADSAIQDRVGSANIWTASMSCSRSSAPVNTSWRPSLSSNQLQTPGPAGMQPSRGGDNALAGGLDQDERPESRPHGRDPPSTHVTASARASRRCENRPNRPTDLGLASRACSDCEVVGAHARRAVGSVPIDEVLSDIDAAARPRPDAAPTASFTRSGDERLRGVVSMTGVTAPPRTTVEELLCVCAACS